MNHLFREKAPIGDAAWEQIDDEARRRLRTYLAARRLVDFRGPHGWGYSAHDLGRTRGRSTTRPASPWRQGCVACSLSSSCG
ncbi:MAG: encapsulin [Acidimicrobiales bacterium]